MEIEDLRFYFLSYLDVQADMFEAHLFQNILLPHEFLPFSVGFVHHYLQNILPTVWDVHHKENQIFKKFGHKPAEHKWGCRVKVQG